ncbi:hypothetical protein [Lignipirellula cremea]|uniref:Uncharacterized protein n=1 Tax=Lignipirellula cremea TaxID=2528010 RepID=A0A518DVJ4_9BACT|nr:hypothetical protein [Lignipirellula cremea]QDU95855.1 hypothetical protein Pla8534_36740 [Lignipirellula cremea]
MQRVTVTGLCLASCLIAGFLGAWISRREAVAQSPSQVRERFVAPRVEPSPATTSQADGVAVVTVDLGNEQQITLIDTKASLIRVYHVERNSGRIALKSVRNIHWDGQMEEFNAASPSPREIRSLVSQR